MFANVLIANRGEIACRIVRTAQRMGMKSIALHTPVDRGALFTRLADEAHEIGEGANGYLDQAAIVALAATETINPAALHYANRLSDHLFVMARTANDGGMGDVLWVPGGNR